MTEGKPQPKSDAGFRLWRAQLQQGTGLCIGLDLHYDPALGIDRTFYARFNNIPLQEYFHRLVDAYESSELAFDRNAAGIHFRESQVSFLAGITEYFKKVIDIAWGNGIRTFKPQKSFFELLGHFGSIIQQILCRHIQKLAAQTQQPYFIILDAKIGDISSTQAAYYRSYFTAHSEQVMPGLNGLYDVDAVTVNAWMGEDVLTPGLSFFKEGKSAVVVTKTSNPSGTTLQDLTISPNANASLDDAQRKFEFGRDQFRDLRALTDWAPTAHETMLFIAETFSKKHALEYHGISPIFSVIGATFEAGRSFRKIRPGGVALVPGLGEQKGSIEYVMPLLATEGELRGHIGILAESRSLNFAWMKKYGGDGNPNSLGQAMCQSIRAFKIKEREAYRSQDKTAFCPF